MKYIELFEAYASKNISAIEKFLNQLGKEDRDYFIDTLKSVSEKTDIPLSTFKGDYMKAMSAIKIETEDNLIKFWFSLKDGLTGITRTKNFTQDQLNFHKFQHQEPWMNNDFIQNFIIGNLIIDSDLREKRWTEESYSDIISSEFALVINISKLEKGLKDLKAKRREARQGALKLSSDEFIRLDNDRRRKEILRKRNGITKDDVLDFMLNVLKKYRCYDPMDLLDCCYELFYRGKIERDMLSAVMDELEERYGDDLGSGKFGGFGVGRFKRYGNFDSWGDPYDYRRNDYGYNDF